MNPLTIVLPFFCNQGMLREQQRVWADLPEDIRAHLHVVVVDDCSPKGERVSRKSSAFEGLASMRVFRLLEKKRWNWLACRNLGAWMSTTEWIVLTDIDHVLPPETLSAVMLDDLDPWNAYRFKRVTASKPWPYDAQAMPAYKPHNDTWLLTRDLFYFDDGQKFVRGYDERLSGCYGTSGEFTYRLGQVAKAVVIRNDVIVRYPRELIPDASTLPTVYSRKNDPANDAQLKARKDSRSAIPNWRPLHRQVRSECVYTSLSEEVVC